MSQKSFSFLLVIRLKFRNLTNNGHDQEVPREFNQTL